MPSSIKLVKNDYATLADKLREAAKAIVKNAAFNVEHRAKDKAPVDTGALKSSIYTVTSESSGYAEAASGAGAVNGNATMQSEEPRPDRATLAVVHAGMDYATYVEFGTVHMGAQPFLVPAVEDERPDWEHALSKLEERLKA